MDEELSIMHAGITVEMNKVIYHFILKERKKEEAFIRSSFVILDTLRRTPSY